MGHRKHDLASEVKVGIELFSNVHNEIDACS
jgi:hypothetical protein